MVLQSDNALVLNYNLPDTNQSFIGFNIFDLGVCEPDIIKPILEGLLDIGSASYKKVLHEYTYDSDYPSFNLTSPNFALVKQFKVDSAVENLAVNLITFEDKQDKETNCGRFSHLEIDTDEVTPNGTVIASETPYDNDVHWTRIG